MNDITTKEDVVLLVDSFYSKVKIDPLLGPVFISKLGVDNWDKHLKRMYSFWNTILLGHKDFRGHPFAKHSPLPIAKDHFERWIFLFKETLDDNFEGPKSKQALISASKISMIFQAKLEHQNANRKY